ncbi:hypothetical protein F5880DRAFT_1494316, partial [Lentinula raphanica]
MERERLNQGRSQQNQQDEDESHTEEDPHSDFFDSLPDDFVASVSEIHITNKFIDALKKASLESELEPLDAEFIQQLRAPLQEEVTITNPDHRLSIDLFLSVTNAAEETYNSVRSAILRRYPDSDILSFYKVKNLVTSLSGVKPIYRDMCVNSCVGLTGPFSELEVCPYCGEDRYEKRNEAAADDTEEVEKPSKSRKQFCTIPIGPQLQALWRSPQGAQSMKYRKMCTEYAIKEL